VTTSVSEVRALIAAGEDQQAEFKASVPRPSNLARDIAGLANATGGRILIGVGEGPTTEEAIHGVDIQSATLAVHRAILLLRPPPDVEIDTLTISSKAILVVKVDKSLLTPVLTQGVAYVRESNLTVLADAHRLVAMVQPNESRDDLMRRLEQFGSAIEQQGAMLRQLQADGGWRHKLMWAIIGGVIGVLLSIPLIFLK
jgi:predicted HTH transcriptional regulator